MVYAGLAMAGALVWAGHLREARTLDDGRGLLAPLAALLGLAFLGLGCGFWFPDAVTLRGLYDDWLGPGCLGTAGAAGLLAILSRGRGRQSVLLLGGAALLAALVLRLDARALELLTRLDEGAAVRQWFSERLALIWPLRVPLATLSVLMALGSVWVARLPRGVLLLTGVGLGAGGLGLSAGWRSLHTPGAVTAVAGLPVLEAPWRPLPPSSALLAAPTGMHLALIPPEVLDGAAAVAVRLPGTESLPEALRWVGVRGVSLQASTAADPGDALVGVAGQVWLHSADGLSSLGGLRQAPARLAAGGAVVVRPDLDWTVGDLAALCAARGCALRPRAAAGLPAAPGRAALP